MLRIIEFAHKIIKDRVSLNDVCVDMTIGNGNDTLFMAKISKFVYGFDKAVEVVRNADIFLVIGTSLTVQPAASLVRYAHPEIPRFIINPGEAYDPYDDHFPEGYEHIKENATTGIEIFIDKAIELCSKYAQ